jgi:hypothetical protein
MDFLKRAETYTESRGDDVFFNWIYANHREDNNVRDSVWKSLSYLYGNSVADMLEVQ